MVVLESESTHLVLLLLETVLEEDEVGRDVVRTVALQDDHAFGVHLLAQVEAIVVEVGEDVLGPLLHASLKLLDAVWRLLLNTLLQPKNKKDSKISLRYHLHSKLNINQPFSLKMLTIFKKY